MQLVAYTVPLIVLPSSIWRLPAVFDDGIGLGERAYIVLLSILSEALAFTAIGLIARWGEVFPRWIPFLRGRRVPTKVTAILAAIGATVLTLGTVLTLVTELMGTTIRGDDLPANYPSEIGGWQTAWFYVCYAPLILWGPLLAVLTIAYWKRHRVPQNMLARA
jgi:glycerol-3-phosphate acyltransferase PlsY